MAENILWYGPSPRWPIDTPVADHAAGDLVVENGRFGISVETCVTVGAAPGNSATLNPRTTLITRCLVLLPVPVGTAAGTALYWQGGPANGATIQLAPQKTMAVPSTLSVQGPLDPPPAPVPTTAPVGGTVPAGTYTAVVTYVTPQGETTASAVGTVVVSGSTSTLTVPSPPLTPLASGWNVYLTQPNRNTLVLQPGGPLPQGAPVVLTAVPSSTGAAPPPRNTSAGLLIGVTSKAATNYGATLVAPVQLAPYPTM